MSKINAICVYCGSSPGTEPAFIEAAQKFGKILAENGVRLIYGGGSVGLMGALAECRARTRRRGDRHHPGISDQAGAAAAAGAGTDRHAATCTSASARCSSAPTPSSRLPGGLGTLEELVEQLTWAQLGRHKKPILIANISGYWDPLLALIDHMRAVKFVPPALRVDFLVAERRRGHPADAAARPPRQRAPRRTRQMARAANGSVSSLLSLLGPHALSSKTSPPRCGCRRDRG